MTDKDLKKECEKYGEIESIRILHKKGCAFVNYVAVKNATAALHGLQGRRLNDQVIKVNYGKVCPHSLHPGFLQPVQFWPFFLSVLSQAHKKWKTRKQAKKFATRRGPVDPYPLA